MFSAEVPLVLNAGAGSTQAQGAAEQLTDLLRSHGIQPRLVTAAGNELEDLVRDELAAGATRILVAGGDGSVSAAANAISGTDVVLGVLPLGTVNHFAKDLGMPSSVRRSVECLANGVVRRVDVATVNGRVFVNNSSIGAYPQLIEERRSDPVLQGKSRRAAMLLAALRTVRRPQLFRARIEVGSEQIDCVTPFVFVGNNAYDGNLLRLEWRARLDTGKLWVCAAPHPDKGALFRAAGRLLWKSPLGDQRLVVRSGEVVTVHVDRKELAVAYDGESESMAPPLDYRIHPRALRVLVPKVA